MSHDDTFHPRRFVIGQFGDSDAMLDGAKRLRERGYKKLDTHTPYPVHGIEEALGLGRPKIPTIVLFGAILGACLAYGMIHYMNVIDFPINVANRPIHSPPLNIPITFELAVLLGGCSAFFGLFALLRFPEPYHPVFESAAFSRASIDGFFLSAEVAEGETAEGIAADMQALGDVKVEIVEESER
jgi:hypothetical protein